MGGIYGSSAAFTDMVCKAATTLLIFLGLWYLVRAIVWKPKKKQRELLELIKAKEGVDIPEPSGSQLPSAEYLGRYLDPPRVMYYREVYSQKYKSQRLKIAGLTLLAYLGLGVLLFLIEQVVFLPSSIDINLGSVPQVFRTFAPRPTAKPPPPVVVVIATNPPAPLRTQVPPTATRPITNAMVMAASDCREWNNLTPADEGKELCVYGELADIVEDTPPPQEYCRTIIKGGGSFWGHDEATEREVCETWVPYSKTYWYFKNLRFPSPPYIYNPDTPYPIGSCIWVKGQIGFDEEGAPTLTGPGTYNSCSYPP